MSDGTAVLIIPDRTLREILSASLQVIGLAVETFEQVEPARAAVRTMAPDLLLIDAGESIAAAARMVTLWRRDPSVDRTVIIVLGDSRLAADQISAFTGGADDYVAKPIDLDEFLARLKAHLRRSAREQLLNPLTRLPGHAAVALAAHNLLVQRTPFAILYIDINQFKAYNDAYGFAAGDQVIMMLGRDVVEAARTDGAGLSIGHIGGDDFLILVADPDAAGDVAARLIAAFTRRLSQIYMATDLERGYTEVIDRRRQWVRAPLLTLSVAGVPYRGEPEIPWGLIASRAAELKQVVKQGGGDRYLLDRRRLEAPGTGLPRR